MRRIPSVTSSTIAVNASGLRPGANAGGRVASRPVSAKMPMTMSGATTAPSPTQASRMVHGSFSYRSIALSTAR